MKITTVLATASLMTGLFAVEATPTYAAGFDGTWKVRRTGVGCKPKGLIRVRVSKGKISGSYRGGTGRHRISGAIRSSGSFSFTARSPKDRVRFSGRISGKSGSGRWNVAGKRCSGSLRISK